MRWTRNDSLAFDAVSKAGEQLRNAYERAQLGDAYNEGMQVQERNGAEIPAQYAEGIDDAGQLGYNKPQYGLGKSPTTWSDTAPTRMEKHRAGLQSQADFLAARGDVERSNALYDQLDQMESRGIQTNLAKLQLGERQAVAKHFADQQSALKELTALREQYAANPNDLSVLKKLSAWYQKVPNGEDFSYDADNGFIALTKNGYGKTAPATPELVGKLFDGAAQRVGQHFDAQYGALGPAQYHDMRKLGLSERQLQILDDRYKAADETTRRGQDLTYDAKIRGLENALQRAELRAGQGVGSNSQNWQAFGSDADGTPVLLNSKNFDPTKPGTGLVRIDGKPVQSIGHVYKSRTGDRGSEGKTGLQPVQGNPGMFSDGRDMYQFDGKQFVPVITPQGLDAVKATLEANRNAKEGQGEGSYQKHNVTRPTEATEYFKDPVTGESIPAGEYYRKYKELPGQGFVGGIINKLRY